MTDLSREQTYDERPDYIDKESTDLGELCSLRSCRYAATIKRLNGPWLCDHCDGVWLEREVDRLRSALTEVAQDLAHLGWHFQGTRSQHEFERIGRKAEELRVDKDVQRAR